MSGQLLPKYPIYVPSKSRFERPLTASFLKADGVPFHLVIEAQEYDQYAASVGEEHLLVLPFSNQGSVIPARNWIKAHAIESGAERHWQLDDNIWCLKRRWKGKRIPIDTSTGLRIVEEFTDRYENVAISGMNYEMFVINGMEIPPFFKNVHVYSCCLILNSLPYQWRGRYNEDTDLCLQVLSGGYCTLLFNAVLAFKVRSMQIKGGNTKELYHGDGRLKMSRALERLWPGVVETRRRFHRPQHYIKDAWQAFDTPLIKKPGVIIADGPNEFGMELKQLKPIKSPIVQRLYDEYNEAQKDPE